jgi:uncharacterized protein
MMNKRTALRTLSAFAAFAALATAAVSNALTLGKKMKQTMPEEFFEGAQLNLARAIRAANTDDVRRLSKLADLNAPAQRGITLLFFAMQEAMAGRPEHLKIFSELIRLGADPLLENKEAGGSVAAISAGNSSPKLVEALLDGGMSVDAMASKYTPLIFRAATEHTFETLKLLVGRGANVNAKDSLGQTALVETLNSLQLDQTEYLLNNGALPNAVNRLGVSFAYALSRAIDKQARDTGTYAKLEQVRALAIAKGMKWPPNEPVVERDLMRARGEKPVVPAGQPR